MTIALMLFHYINQNSIRKLHLTVQLLKGQMGITQRQRVPERNSESQSISLLKNAYSNDEVILNNQRLEKVQ